MELMRHSDIRLTMKIYTDAGKFPRAAIVAKLPALGVSKNVSRRWSFAAICCRVVTRFIMQTRACERLSASHLDIMCRDLTSPAGINDNGRAGEIRTHDLLHPMQARYQATLQPDERKGEQAACRPGKQAHFLTRPSQQNLRRGHQAVRGILR